MSELDYARQALRWGNTSGEGFGRERFFDLVRWGIVKQTMNKYITAESDNRILLCQCALYGWKG